MITLHTDCPSTWRENANITLVGEAPGESETKCAIGPLCQFFNTAPTWKNVCRNVTHREGFSGTSGSALTKQLHMAGLLRDACHLTNVAKRRPPKNDFKAAFYQTKVVGRKKVEEPTDELLAWYETLRQDLEAHPTNVIVALGNEPLKALCGVTGITHYRGSVLESTLLPGRKVVAMLHPSFVVRGQFGMHWISGSVDMRRVKHESRFPEIVRKPWDSYIFPGFSEVLKFLRYIPNHEMWCVDVETRGDTLACVGIGWENQVMCIPIQVSTGPTWSAHDERIIWQEIQDLFRRNPNLVGQNIQYDLEYLMDYGCEPLKIRLDTRIAHALLYPELPHKLEFLTSIYTDLAYYKEEGKTWGSRTPDEDLHKYNCKDVWATLEVARGLEHEMVRAQMKASDDEEELVKLVAKSAA